MKTAQELREIANDVAERQRLQITDTAKRLTEEIVADCTVFAKMGICNYCFLLLGEKTHLLNSIVFLLEKAGFAVRVNLYSDGTQTLNINW